MNLMDDCKHKLQKLREMLAWFIRYHCQNNKVKRCCSVEIKNALSQLLLQCKLLLFWSGSVSCQCSGTRLLNLHFGNFGAKSFNCRQNCMNTLEDLTDCQMWCNLLALMHRIGTVSLYILSHFFHSHIISTVCQIDYATSL